MRPKDWVNPYEQDYEYDYADIFEAGADAIIPFVKEEGRRELLEELMAKAVYRNYVGLQTGSDPAELAVSVPNVKGWLVFIPEEQK